MSGRRVICPSCHRYVDNKLEKQGIYVDSTSMKLITCPYCYHKWIPGKQNNQYNTQNSSYSSQKKRTTSKSYIICPKCHGQVDKSNIHIEEVYDKEYSTKRKITSNIIGKGLGAIAAV